MIKAIATDMDSTFLRNDGTYNHLLFKKLWHQLQTDGSRLIIASGNQYAQLKSFFPDTWQEMTFVSENGALVFEDNKVTIMDALSPETVKTIFTTLTTFATDTHKIESILCGVSHAYIQEDATPRFKEFAKTYYHDLVTVADWHELPDDTFVKIALDVTLPRPQQLVDQLNQQLNGKVIAVNSGHGSIDISVPGINKGNTVKKLLANWDLTPNDLAAFGDADNDLELLQLTPNSYAMAVHSPKIGEAAQHQIGDNDQDAALQTMITITHN